MEHTPLGNTGPTVAGLGCGGNSRAGAGATLALDAFGTSVEG